MSSLSRSRLALLALAALLAWEHLAEGADLVVSPRGPADHRTTADHDGK